MHSTTKTFISCLLGRRNIWAKKKTLATAKFHRRRVDWTTRTPPVAIMHIWLSGRQSVTKYPINKARYS